MPEFASAAPRHPQEEQPTTTTNDRVDTAPAPLLTYKVGAGRYAYRSPQGLRLSHGDALAYLATRYGIRGFDAHHALDMIAAEAVGAAGPPRVERSTAKGRTLYALEGTDPVDRSEANRRLTGEWRLTPVEAADLLDQATARP